IWFRAGSALEEKSNEGIAHFLEHMFFKGTPKRPGAAIAHEVESFGGEINAFTSFDYTCYYINTPNNHLLDTTEILLDMVSNPQFKLDDLLPERDVVFEEYRRSIDNPGQFSFHKLQKASFTGGYAHPILGREETIKNFTQDQLKEFRKNYYNLSNALFVVSGDLSQKEKIVNSIESFKLPEGPESKFPKFKLKNKSTLEVHNKDVRMAQLTMCIQAPEFKSPTAVEEDLALNCLGHGESSRLYQSMVAQDSLANSCAASTMFMNNGGVHFLRVIFPPKDLKKVLARVHKIINDAIKEGFSDEELSKIKNQYIASKVYDMESLESFSFSLGHSFAQTGDINGEEVFIDTIKKATRAKVENGLRGIFAKPTHLSLQLPKGIKLEPAKKDIQAFQKKLSQLQKSVLAPSKSKYKFISSKFDPQVKCYTIKNGVKLLYRQNTMNPTFVTHAYIKGGITEETAKDNGIYQVLSGVLSKGHSKIPYRKLKEILEDRSASLSGFSGKNAYGLTMHGQSEHFNELMYHFCGTLMKPDFPAERIKHEKEITLRNLENQQEDPVKQCFQKVSQLHFNGHPYAMNIQGNPTSLKKISRKSIVDKHLASLKNREILLTYCGDKELEEVIEQLEPILESLKARAPKKLTKKKLAPITGKSEFIEFEREQTQIFYGIPTSPLGSKENTYLKMLT
ncbi:insulinase family protein, partial [Bacteriovoracaceae bacterium]|nr:insulinase family protein [Bacteriovoracaceae bacterium]